MADADAMKLARDGTLAYGKKREDTHREWRRLMDRIKWTKAEADEWAKKRVEKMAERVEEAE